ncbi:MAG TPA: hypothetical protein VM692_01630 [Gammaproteobacteria bacterium]|nr:hypothetical protein [Gammaproteobacteria bacterium]
MSGRVKELLERERRLQERCAAQRASIAVEVAAIEARFVRVDRMAGLARNALLNPFVIGGGIVALLTIGRLRGMRLIGRLYLLATAARRLMLVVRAIPRARVEPEL